MSSNPDTSTNNNDIKTLLDFINRLGNATRGISREIDHKLSKIKSLSDKGATELEQLSPLFSSITSVLQREQGRLKQQLAHTHLQISQATHTLLDSEQLDSADKEELRNLINTIDAPLYSYTELLPIMLDLVQVYRRQLQHQANTRATKELDSKPICLDKVHTLQAELSNLLSSIDFNGQARTKLATLRQRLLNSTSPELLLSCCIEALQLIIRSINEERLSAQHFLLSLNDTLDSVNKALVRTLHAQEKSTDAQSEIMDTLRGQVTTLADAVQDTTHMQDLKQQVHQHIVGISETLANKLKLEAQAQQRLRTKLLGMQSRLEDVESEAQMYKRTLNERQFKSLQDTLTRLPNRVAFETRLQLEYQRWQNYAAPLCVAIADIDNFKVINDTYGHIPGDKTLQVIANMLKKSLRETDFVCRLGGEEFVIIFPQTTPEVALELLEKARQKVKSIPFKFKSKSISITISIGVSSFIAEDSPDRIFERSKQALYQAKNNGRDQVYQQ